MRGVVNELAVMGSTTLTQRSSDTLITGKVRASLVDANDLHVSAFKVVTERGTVYLMGRVTQREADRATQMARTIAGVQRVVRIFETISEEELARLAPQQAKPGTAPAPARLPLRLPHLRPSRLPPSRRGRARCGSHHVILGHGHAVATAVTRDHSALEPEADRCPDPVRLMSGA